MTFLILACSSLKAKVAGEIPAAELYQGTMFKRGLKLARMRGWKVYILSAKYGLIEDNTHIKWYNQKMKIPHNGPWPEGDGYYLGGEAYFGNAPPRIKRLVPKTTNGLMIANVDKLINQSTARQKKLF